jgi:hypothetical protein
MNRLQETVAALLCAAAFVTEPETFPAYLEWLRKQAPDSAGSLGDHSRAEILEAIELGNQIFGLLGGAPV